MYQTKQKKSLLSWGFTIIELTVVMSIMAVLAGFVYTAVFQGREESRDLVRISDIEQIKLGIKLYKEAHGSYPDYPEGVELGVGNAIDAELQPFLVHTGGDPLTRGTENSAYGYWYASSFSCGGEDSVVVVAKNVEHDKHSNYESTCGVSGSAEIQPPTFLTYGTKTALAGGGGYGQGSYGSGGGSGACTTNPTGDNNCRLDINASVTSLPAGGGQVKVCWESDPAYSEPPRYVGAPINWSGAAEYESDTVTIDQTTTFTYTTGGQYYGTCSDSVTVTVADPDPEPEPEPEPEPDPEVVINPNMLGENPYVVVVGKMPITPGPSYSEGTYYSEGSYGPVSGSCWFPKSWSFSGGSSCSATCSNQGGTSAGQCISGEARIQEAIDQLGTSVFTYGCWGGGGCSNGNVSSASESGNYCYYSGQKRDSDPTDTTVGCFCNVPDITSCPTPP